VAGDHPGFRGVDPDTYSVSLLLRNVQNWVLCLPTCDPRLSDGLVSSAALYVLQALAVMDLARRPAKVLNLQYQEQLASGVTQR
jgi:hypothetical protein